AAHGTETHLVCGNEERLVDQHPRSVRYGNHEVRGLAGFERAFWQFERKIVLGQCRRQQLETRGTRQQQESQPCNGSHQKTRSSVVVNIYCGSPNWLSQSFPSANLRRTRRGCWSGT